MSRYGKECLSNSELLAIILNTGTREYNAIELSDIILRKGIELGSPLELNLDELMAIKGIGITKACRIIASLELGSRLAKMKLHDAISLASPDSIAAYFYNHYRFTNQEEFLVLLLDTKCNLKSIELISKGTINSTVVHPREVFYPAIKKLANSVILVHNHPSGDITPSMEDIKTTKRLIETGKIIGINVLDHLIIGDQCYFSMKQKDII